MDKLIIGTRGSKLALWQSEHVAQLIRTHHPHIEVELSVIKTQGDKRLDLSLDASGDKGLFTKEIEHALLRGDIHMAVHSLKDLPVDDVAGTCLISILPREDARDVLLGADSLHSLKPHAVVGTSSPRRAKQLLSMRSDLQIKPIRGNVDSRIAQLDSAKYDAIVMAAAGLKRLGWEDRIDKYFSTEELVSAPGQGAIAVQVRSTDIDTLAPILGPLHCQATALATDTERQLLKALGGGCAIPFGCRCQVMGENIALHAFYWDGEVRRVQRRFPTSQRLQHIQELATYLRQRSHEK